MFSWLKKHFIPHAGNNHRPHILRDENARRIIGFVIILEIFAFLLPTLTQVHFMDGMAAVLPAVLGDLTNEKRAGQKLPTLSVNPLLSKAAEMKALDMASKGYFAHTSPEGKTPWYWIEQAGYKYQYAGENLAVNFRDSEDVTEAWMKSPTHKANIVKGNYTEIGTGIARGEYKGRRTIFVAQVYANPMPGSLPTASNVSTEQTLATVSGQGNVLGAQVEPLKTTPSWWQELAASPRNTTNVVMAAVFLIIALALVLYLVIKVKGHHFDLVTNGLAMLAVLGAIFVANYQYSYRSMVITQSLDYQAETQPE